MIGRTLLLLCAFCFGTLSGTIEEAGHQIEGVDFIYLINSDNDPEKLEAAIDQLRPYGINPYRFSAMNGWALTLEEINDLGVKFEEGMRDDLLGTCYPFNANGWVHERISVPGRTYFSYRMTRGVIARLLTHLSILQDAFDSGYTTVWVMEDDVLAVRDPCLMSGYVEKLDALVGSDGWDILYTDQDMIDSVTGERVPCLSYGIRANFTPQDPSHCTERVALSEDFWQVGARFGAYSYLIRRSGMEKILNFLKKYAVFLPIDMELPLPADIRLFTVTQDVVSAECSAPSDHFIWRRAFVNPHKPSW